MPNIASPRPTGAGIDLFLNPLIPVLSAATAPVLHGKRSDPTPAALGGLFPGSLGWWSFLGGAISIFENRLTAIDLNSANKAAGLLLAGLAIITATQGFSTFVR